MELSNSNQIKNVCLETGVANLGTKVRKIEMCEGEAWLTYDDKDIALKPGHTIELDATKHPILISPLDGYEQIVFNYEVDKSVVNIKNSGKSSNLHLGTLAAAVLSVFKS